MPLDFFIDKSTIGTQVSAWTIDTASASNRIRRIAKSVALMGRIDCMSTESNSINKLHLTLALMSKRFWFIAHIQFDSKN